MYATVKKYRTVVFASPMTGKLPKTQKGRVL